MAFQLTNSSLQWADSQLGDVALNFDEVAFTITQLNGYVLRVRAVGYISFSLDGLWSDRYVSSGEVVDSDELIDRAAAFAAGQPEPESGNPDRDEGTFLLLRIRLDSGGVLECVAHRFIAEQLR
jgi:hypothetical protein